MITEYTKILIPLNIKSKNGRIYTKQNIESPIKEYMIRINKNISYGELNHPDRLEVDLSEISHMITDIWFEDDFLMGKIKILDTPKGRLLKSMIDIGFEFSVRQRATGFVDTQGYAYIKEISSFDIIDINDDSFSTKKIIRKLKLSKIQKSTDLI